MNRKRPTLAEFKRDALSDPKVVAEYERLKPEFELAKRLIQARKRSGLTQEEVAKRMKTQKPNIARLERIGTTKPSPTFSTLLRYAEAVGCRFQFKFTPEHSHHA